MWSQLSRRASYFQKDNARRNGVHTTASGLQYKLLNGGIGSKVGPKDTVVIYIR